MVGARSGLLFLKVNFNSGGGGVMLGKAFYTFLPEMPLFLFCGDFTCKTRKFSCHCSL